MSSERTTKAYKVDPEVRSKVEELFQASGVATEGDFLDHMATVYSMHLMKTGSGYEKQIAGLEYHTKSIIEGVMSLLHTEAAERVKISEGYEEKLTERGATVWEQERQIRELTGQVQNEAKVSAELRKDLEGWQKQAQQLQVANERGELLMNEYREQILSLTKTIQDNQKTVEASKHVREQLDEWVNKATQNARERDAVRAELEAVKTEHDKAVASLSASYAWDIENIQTRAELAKEKAVLTAQREAQERLETERAGHTEQVRKLYEELDRVRQQLAEAQKPKPNKPKQPGT